MTDNELYCYQACKARLRRERAEAKRGAPWLFDDHFAARTVEVQPSRFDSRLPMRSRSCGLSVSHFQTTSERQPSLRSACR